MIKKDSRTLIKIAHYYYKLGMTQDQIAKKLFMSRQKVNRVINSLVKEGIVTITINGYDKSYVDLEEKIEEKFNLQEVIIASVEEEENLIDKLGITSARYLEKIIQDNSIIGVSWGSTLSAVIDNLSSIKKDNISVVQLVGGTNIEDSSIKPDEITRVMANKLGGTEYLMYAPALVKDKTIRESFMKEKSINNVFNIIENCDIALVGIGSLDEESTLYKNRYISEEEVEKMKNSECVGDICLRTYKKDGSILPTNLDNRVIGVGIESLKKMPLVVGVAGGKEKVNSISGALRTGAIDVLITDNNTAKGIISEFDKGRRGSENK